MTFETILYREEGPVGWLTLNRPDDGNMFTPQMCHEIRDCINDIRRETRTRVLVITGAGDKFFCIGGRKDGMEDSTLYAGMLPTLEIYESIERLQKPVIASVNGYAVGGGQVLQVMCDLTIAKESAVFRQVGPMMGSFDAGYGTWYLEDLVGKKKAKEMWFLNPRLTAREALEIGLINKVVPDDKLEEETRAMAEAVPSAARSRWPRSKARSSRATAAYRASRASRTTCCCGSISTPTNRTSSAKRFAASAIPIPTSSAIEHDTHTARSAGRPALLRRRPLARRHAVFAAAAARARAARGVCAARQPPAPHVEGARALGRRGRRRFARGGIEARPARLGVAAEPRGSGRRAARVLAQRLRVQSVAAPELHRGRRRAADGAHPGRGAVRAARLRRRCGTKPIFSKRRTRSLR